MKSLKGLIVPLVTPMNDDLSIDSFGLKTLSSWLMNKGVKNYFLLSPFGEQQFLNDGQQTNLLNYSKKIFSDNSVILTGCFSDTTEGVIDKVNSFSKFSDYCVINIPLPSLSNEVFFIDFFEQIFNQTKSNILIYNDPFVFRKNMPIIGLDKIANWERLVGVIDYSSNPTYFSALLDYHQSIKIFQGVEEQAMDCFDYRCSGIAPILSNIFPSLFSFNTRSSFIPYQSKINSLLKEFFPREARIQAMKKALAVKGLVKEHHSRELPLVSFNSNSFEEQLFAAQNK